MFGIFYREKFHAKAYENPIRDAVVRRCFSEILYGSRVNGDEILNILCNKNCTRLHTPDGKMRLFNKTHIPDIKYRFHRAS